MRKNSIKNVRINREVQRELSLLLNGGVKDPRISPMTSVTRVRVAPDLKTCKVYISVLGGPQEVEDTMEGLKSANGFIRSSLARTVNLRNTPELQFICDQSIEYGVAMTKKIEEVVRTDSEREAGTREESEDQREDREDKEEEEEHED